MPRTARASLAGWCYHVLNRGDRRAELCHTVADYAAFTRLLRQASARVPMRVLAYCLMPNHFHLGLWPLADGDLGRWMQWLLTNHVRRYHARYRSSGRLWQGRFKAFPIEQDEHLLTVLRYIERNPLRTGLVSRAEAWPWSSLRWWGTATGLPFLDPGPIPRGSAWVAHVNMPLHEGELRRLRYSVGRGAPYGSEAWTTPTAAALGLGFTLRPPGRPPTGAVTPPASTDTPTLFPEET
jgi:putative transposase